MPASESPRRLEILEAAIIVFAERGFNRSRVADVARKAGVADGTIYLYFKNKDDILISIFERKLEEYLLGAREVLSELVDPCEQLRRIVTWHMRNVETNREVAAVLLVELRLSNKFMKDYVPTKLRAYMKLIGNVIERGQAEGIFDDRHNPVIVRRSLFGALDELAMQWILTPNPRYGLEASANQVADIFIKGLRRE